MKYLAALVLLLAACAPEKTKTAEVVKFDQPAAPMPVAFLTDDCADNNCDAVYPSPGGDSFTYYFERCLYISHYLYWPAYPTGTYSCYITEEEWEWVIEKESDYLYWMDWVGNRPLNVFTGNYCRVADSCGPYTFYKLVPTSGNCATGDRIYVSSANYAEIVDAATGMTCAMCFLRDKGVP